MGAGPFWPMFCALPVNRRYINRRNIQCDIADDDQSNHS